MEGWTTAKGEHHRLEAWFWRNGITFAPRVQYNPSVYIIDEVDPVKIHMEHFCANPC